MGDESFKKPLVAAFDHIFGPARVRFEREREGDRVRELVRKMGEYDAAERALAQAQMAFENGNTACLEETVIRPTPELLASGKFEPFAADTVKGTARSVTTVRRKLMSHIVEYYQRGVIDDAGLTACRWYKDVYESTGLTGNVASTDFGKEVFTDLRSRCFFTEWQIDNQDMWRGVRLQMTSRWLPFFDAVVLDDVSPRTAIRLARKRNGKEVGLFRDVVSELVAAYDTLKKTV